jgi:hypothetical protein
MLACHALIGIQDMSLFLLTLFLTVYNIMPHYLKFSIFASLE